MVLGREALCDGAEGGLYIPRFEPHLRVREVEGNQLRDGVGIVAEHAFRLLPGGAVVARPSTSTTSPRSRQ